MSATPSPTPQAPSPRVATARGAGLLVCEACSAVQHPLHGHDASHTACWRCNAPLHWRRPASVARTWALLIAALILYIPANVLPVMETGSLFGAQRDTIFSGVVFLWNDGSWPLAIVIFVASIGIPLSKLVALTFLLVSVQRGSTWRPLFRAQVYRLIEAVGRWSMVDIFVAALLVKLVQFRALATVQVAPGAIAFGAVVVLTMLATSSFDPRMIWDPVEKRSD